jgi:site-specific recombinase XerD
MDIYNHERILEALLKRIKESNLSDSNKKYILGFHRHCLSNGLSVSKTVRYLQDLKILAEWLCKDFNEATKGDIEELAAKLETSKYAKWTKKGLKIILKKFYKWLRQVEEGYPLEVKWIKTAMKRNGEGLPEILTEAEVVAMINATKEERNKALISTLYESGCRIGELMNLRIKDITFNDNNGIDTATLVLSGKTGARRILLISSVPYLQSWLNKHPDKNNQEAYLWIKTTKLPATYSRIKTIIKDIAKRAGIQKRVYPHLFRHSRASYLANFLTEAQMKEFFGWTQSSQMCQVYIHMSGRDVDNAILKSYGIKTNNQEEQEVMLKPQKCERCQELNESTNQFCKRCGLVLKEETRNEMLKNEMDRQQADEVMNELVKDKEVLKFLIHKIKEKKLYNSL